jgi:hypothetical protein
MNQATSYDAISARRYWTGFERGEGVSTYGSFRVSQRGAGVNMSVDVNMDDGAYVRGDAVALQGLYYVSPHSATINEVVTAADATNPRIDQVVLELKDNAHDASGANLVQTRVVAGTATVGATLDNRTGAAALPSSALLLADVLVGATVTSISNANIRDRRAFVAGTVPPVLTAVDQVSLSSPAREGTLDSSAPIDLSQTAALVYVPRRIAAATRIRWHYFQGATALTGNYVLGIYDATGRKIVDTGSVAFTGGIGSSNARSETITATTFEPGAYYALLGADTTNAGTIGYVGWGGILGTTITKAADHAPNVTLYSLTGGVTAPTTLLSFTDYLGFTSGLHPVPRITLSVG